MTTEQVLLLESLDSTLKIVAIGSLVVAILLVISITALWRQVRKIEEKIEYEIIVRIEDLEDEDKKSEDEVKKFIRDIARKEVESAVTNSILRL